MNNELTYYVAPLEGVTGYLFRNAHAALFPGADAYFAPFVTPKAKKGFTGKEKNDIHPENNRNVNLVPQILTNDAEGFITSAHFLAELGYQTVNLNLGCPSGTVFSKGKGSGFLAYQPELDRFLEHICKDSPLPVSVKTRVGVDHEEEWEELLPIFNRYPLESLIIHPRLRSDFYKNHPHMNLFRDAVELSKNPVVYNGDLFTAADVEAFAQAFPTIKTVMLGRGVVANPALIRQCQGGAPLNRDELRRFHDQVVEQYRSVLSGERPLLFKMKELWFYMIGMFENAEKPYKALRKAQRWSNYQSAVSALFSQCPLSPEGHYRAD